MPSQDTKLNLTSRGIQSGEHEWQNHVASFATCASFREPGTQNERNDDRAVIAGNLLAVLDGATSVDPTVRISGYGTAEYIAEWSSQWLSNNASTQWTAREYLIRLNEAFAAHLREQPPVVAALGKLGPAATVTILAYNPVTNVYSFAHLGDTSLYAKSNNGEWRRLTADLVTPSSLAIREKLRKLRAEGDPNLPMLEVELEIEWRNRYYNTNEHSSFGILNGEQEMTRLIHQGEISGRDVCAFILMTDGAEYPADGGSLKGAKLVEDEGPASYICKLLDLYDTDPSRGRFPRAKHSDDMTLILAAW